MQTWIERHQWQTALTACVVALVFLGVFIGMAVPVAAAAQPSYCGETLRGQDRTSLPGHLIPILRGIVPLRSMDCKAVLSLTITLRARNTADLASFMQAVNDPKSPQYHHYLSTQDYADRFGQTPAAIDQLTAYLRSAGFTIQEVTPNRLSIRVSATVAAIERAFALHLGLFRFAGQQVHAPLEDPSIPANYAAAIQSIAGLSDLPVAFVPRYS
ncbi:MAG: hypothetical protein H0X24_06875 [Ktedonobacterales bacterium]|nr:hypothetical protein [Ktedonobacterales bacterium]